MKNVFKILLVLLMVITLPVYAESSNDVTIDLIVD